MRPLTYRLCFLRSSIPLINKFFTAVFVVGFLVFAGFAGVLAEEQDRLQQCVEKGNKLRDQERYQEALTNWEQCLRLDPANSMLNSLIMITKGQMAQEEDRYTRIGTRFYHSEPGKALQAWRKVVSINPRNQEASENARKLEEEIDAQVSNPLADAEVLLKNKELIHAQEHVADALRLDPRHPKALELMKQIKAAYVIELKDRAGRAEQYYRAGNYGRAARMFEDLVLDKAYPPEDLSRSYTYLGLSYASLDNDQSALESFRNALRFNHGVELPRDTPDKIRELFHKAKNGG